MNRDAKCEESVGQMGQSLSRKTLLVFSFCSVKQTYSALFYNTKIRKVCHKMAALTTCIERVLTISRTKDVLWLVQYTVQRMAKASAVFHTKDGLWLVQYTVKGWPASVVHSTLDKKYFCDEFRRRCIRYADFTMLWNFIRSGDQ